MTQFSDQEDTLVHFLRQYRPIPPTISSEVEEELMSRIQSESRARRSLAWEKAIPWAIAAGAVMVWSGSQLLQPKPKIAFNSQEPSMAANSREIESFLVDNWRETFADSTSIASPSPYGTTARYANEPYLVFADFQQ